MTYQNEQCGKICESIDKWDLLLLILLLMWLLSKTFQLYGIYWLCLLNHNLIESDQSHHKRNTLKEKTMLCSFLVMFLVNS